MNMSQYLNLGQIISLFCIKSKILLILTIGGILWKRILML